MRPLCGRESDDERAVREALDEAGWWNYKPKDKPVPAWHVPAAMVVGLALWLLGSYGGAQLGRLVWHALSTLGAR